MERGGKPILRPKGVGTPCHFCPKIAPGDAPRPENAQELTTANVLAYRFYLESKATGEFPTDGVCRWLASIFAAAEAHAERVNQTRTGMLVLGQLFKGAAHV